jgi:hypothetical protein
MRFKFAEGDPCVVKHLDLDNKSKLLEPHTDDATASFPITVVSRGPMLNNIDDIKPYSRLGMLCAKSQA